MFYVNKESVWKNRRKWIIILILGIILAAALGFYYFYTMLQKDKFNAKVKAFDINENCAENFGVNLCSPIYYFRADKKEYACSSKTSSTQFSRDEDIVFYQTGNPSNCVTEFDTNPSIIFLGGFIIGDVLAVIGIIGLISTIISSRRINNLCRVGVLYKGLDYQLIASEEDSGFMHPEVDLELQDGRKIHLIGETKYDNKYSRSSGKIDVLIDPKNLSNYYMDFGIFFTGDVKDKVIDYNVKDPTLVEKNEKNNEIKTSEKTLDVSNQVASLGEEGLIASTIKNDGVVPKDEGVRPESVKEENQHNELLNFINSTKTNNESDGNIINNDNN